MSDVAMAQVQCMRMVPPCPVVDIARRITGDDSLTENTLLGDLDRDEIDMEIEPAIEAECCVCLSWPHDRLKGCITLADMQRAVDDLCRQRDDLLERDASLADRDDNLRLEHLALVDGESYA